MAPTLKPAYIQKDDQRGDLQVWIVNGEYIRSHIDEEFTNFGQHYRFPFIPKNELWIDREAQQDERAFFIDHLLTEHKLMAQGMPYAQALEQADRAERKERRRAGDIRAVTHKGQKTPDAAVVHERLWRNLKNGVSVWIVKGRLVRSTFDIDFSAGGHDQVYKFVPAGEVWIDDDIEEDERAFVLLHEIHERSLMAKGMSYDKAHAASSRLEFNCRHHSDKLQPALAAEGWT